MIPRYLVNFKLQEFPHIRTDVLVIGTSTAGLNTAASINGDIEVIILGKKEERHINSGGETVIKENREAHYKNTLKAGAGLCNKGAVKILINNINNVLTGCKRADDRDNIRYHQGKFVVDLLTEQGVCYGALIYDLKQESYLVYLAQVVVLASNSTVEDEIAVAYRAGVEVMDMEFIQFQPTYHVIGGIKANTEGVTNISRLFVCGSAACFGVHGADSLAGNIYLEELVYSKRVAEKINKVLKVKRFRGAFPDRNYSQQKKDNFAAAEVKWKLKKLMNDKVGIIRAEKGLTEALNQIKSWGEYLQFDFSSLTGFEIQNLLTTAYLTAKAALIREESRGVHYRSDFPAQKKQWEKHIGLQKGKDWEPIEVNFV